MIPTQIINPKLGTQNNNRDIVAFAVIVFLKKYTIV